MNALELLKKDHQTVSDLFTQYNADQDEARRKTLFRNIKSELEAHAHIEETILYPFLTEHAEFKPMVMEAIEEHRQVKTLLREIEHLADGSEKSDAKMAVMQENVTHHVMEEETGLFPRVESVFGPEILEALGGRLVAEKKKVSKK